MRIDLCKHCGTEQQVKQKCHLCREAIQFTCPKCSSVTDVQHHLQCNVVSFHYHLLEAAAA